MKPLVQKNNLYLFLSEAGNEADHLAVVVTLENRWQRFVFFIWIENGKKLSTDLALGFN